MGAERRITPGFLAIVLHAHLPYVRHLERKGVLQENWLFEAITECYIPLLRMFDGLQKDQPSFRLTLSLSPTLLTLLNDEILKRRYVEYLQRRIQLAQLEVIRNRHHQPFHRLANYYLQFFSETLNAYQYCYQQNLVRAFVRHHHRGNLEIITTAATHAFLPLFSSNEGAVRTQILTGIETFEHVTGIRPRGFWLPECGYYPGLEKLLAEAGINYFFTDTHAITHADVTPILGVNAPLDCGNSVYAFGRDPASSRQVWSSTDGYPGDPYYREYHRDMGFEMEQNMLEPFITEESQPVRTGFKYHRVTGMGGSKQLYEPDRALERATQHAQDFVIDRERDIERLPNEEGDQQPIIVAPYDAELFGHWWFEGPLWLKGVIENISKDSNTLTLCTCSDYLTQCNGIQKALPSASSWGESGYNHYWLSEKNSWIYPHIHAACERMERLAISLPAGSLFERTANQAARSLLLAQASDWPFIMQAETTIDYAIQKIEDALARFNYLCQSVENLQIDERQLSALELLDDIFPTVDYRHYNPASN